MANLDCEAPLLSDILADFSEGPAPPGMSSVPHVGMWCALPLHWDRADCRQKRRAQKMSRPALTLFESQALNADVWYKICDNGLVDHGLVESTSCAWFGHASASRRQNSSERHTAAP